MHMCMIFIERLVDSRITCWSRDTECTQSMKVCAYRIFLLLWPLRKSRAKYCILPEYTFLSMNFTSNTALQESDDLWDFVSHPVPIFLTTASKKLVPEAVRTADSLGMFGFCLHIFRSFPGVSSCFLPGGGWPAGRVVRPSCGAKQEGLDRHVDHQDHQDHKVDRCMVYYGNLVYVEDIEVGTCSGIIHVNPRVKWVPQLENH